MTRPLRIVLSAFIVEDMLEFVRAHATYRFVMFDEEEEKPRILVSYPRRLVSAVLDPC
jgi:ubiquitin-protein ligase E3 D